MSMKKLGRLEAITRNFENSVAELGNEIFETIWLKTLDKISPVHALDYYEQKFYYDKWLSFKQLSLDVIDYFVEFESLRRGCGIRRKSRELVDDFIFGLRKEIKKELQFYPVPCSLKEAFLLALKMECRLHNKKYITAGKHENIVPNDVNLEGTFSHEVSDDGHANAEEIPKATQVVLPIDSDSTQTLESIKKLDQVKGIVSSLNNNHENTGSYDYEGYDAPRVNTNVVEEINQNSPTLDAKLEDEKRNGEVRGGIAESPNMLHENGTREEEVTNNLAENNENIISLGNKNKLASQHTVFRCKNSESSDLYSQHVDGIMSLGSDKLSDVDRLVDSKAISDSFSLCYDDMEHGCNLRERKWGGEVVDEPNDSLKQPVLGGAQNDYVFDVVIVYVEPIRMLPYSCSDNPYDTSTKPPFKLIPKKEIVVLDAAQFDGILKRVSELNITLISNKDIKELSLMELEVSRLGAFVKIQKDASHYHTNGATRLLKYVDDKNNEDGHMVFDRQKVKFDFVTRDLDMLNFPGNNSNFLILFSAGMNNGFLSTPRHHDDFPHICDFEIDPSSFDKEWTHFASDKYHIIIGAIRLREDLTLCFNPRFSGMFDYPVLCFDPGITNF